MAGSFGRFRRGDNSIDLEGREIAKIQALEAIVEKLQIIAEMLEMGVKNANSK